MEEFENFDSLSYCNSHMLELLCHAYFPRCDSATQTVEYFVSTPTCNNILNECGGPLYHGRSQQFCQGLMKGRYHFNSCVLPDVTNIRTCSLNNNQRSIPSWFQNSMQMADQSANTIIYLLKYIMPSPLRSNACENSIVNFICDGALFCSSDNQHALTVSSKQKCRDIIKW